MLRAILLILAGPLALGTASAATPTAIGTAPATRATLGQYGRWGVFRDAPGRCFAAAEPPGASRKGRPFVAVRVRRGGGSPRLFVAAGRTIDPGGTILVEISGLSFPLVTAGGDPSKDADDAAGTRAEARGVADDRRMVAAMRRSDRLRVRGVDASGRRFRDDYPLAGAPSAIDAAIVGCS